MNTCKRCPVCFELPEVAIEPKVLNQDGFDIVLHCERHGHTAMGDNLEMAVSNWNIYISGTNTQNNNNGGK